MSASIRRNVFSRTDVGSGGAVDSCWHHCGFAARSRDDAASVVFPDKYGGEVTPLQALMKWWAGEGRVWLQNAPYGFPCDGCCPAGE